MSAQLADRTYRIVFVVYATVLTVSALARPVATGDSAFVATGARALVDCARAGQWTACAGTSQFGVLQHLLAIPLMALGLTVAQTVSILAATSIISVLLLLAVGYGWFRRSPLRGQFMVMVVAAGPLCVYAASAFAEALQALVFVALVMAILARRPAWAAAAAVLAASTRESAAVFLVPMCAAAVLLAPRAARRQLFIAVGAGIVGGVALLLAFNVWKFGTVVNTIYADPTHVVGDWSQRIESFAAVWLAPGGGVVWFWFIGAAAAIVLPVMTLADRQAPASNRCSAALVLVAGFLATAVLASWYAPFGWVAWGPRLMIPTVMTAAVVAIAAGAGSARRWAVRLRPLSRWLVAATVMALTILTAVPNVSALSNDVESVAFAYFTPGVVPVSGPCDVLVDPGNYFTCLNAGAWQLAPSQFTIGWAHMGSLQAVLLAVLTLGLVAIPLVAVAQLGPARPGLDAAVDGPSPDRSSLA